MFCYFVTDLHGKKELYEKLALAIISHTPHVVFIGGDITSASHDEEDFISGYLSGVFSKLKLALKDKYPAVYIILGNDDPAYAEYKLHKLETQGLLQYINFKKSECGGFNIFGYNYVPPTPFMLKDWERYDVSRYLDPGDVSPEEGYRTVEVEKNKIIHSTIAADLEELTKGEDLRNSIFLLHAPPHKTNLDRAANDGKLIDHVPLDLNVGSIAIRRFIEKHQPLVTLHGHIHESTRITGSWKDMLGGTYCFNAAYDGRGLSLIKFDTSDLDYAVREIV